MGGNRTVVLTRSFAGATAAHFSFNSTMDGVRLPWMNAVGYNGTFAFHKLMSSSTLVMARVGVPSCICGEKIVFGDTRAQVGLWTLLTTRLAL